MIDTGEKRSLLTEVVGEGLPVNFREALLEQTLHLARRRRRFRQARRATAFLAVLADLSVVVWRSLPPRPAHPAVLPQHFALVRTRPLPGTALIQSRPLSAAIVVRSVPASAIIATTTFKPVLREVSDDELLALAAPNPAVLVRRGPHLAELVFANSPAGRPPPGN